MSVHLKGIHHKINQEGGLVYTQAAIKIQEMMQQLIETSTDQKAVQKTGWNYPGRDFMFLFLYAGGPLHRLYEDTKRGRGRLIPCRVLHDPAM